ncbi:sugar nucleotide-binding protein [uncultured Salegentibacter sp.]|uniref:SDR family oxidoreductase n=1 Tax=uncultured Salegentibacter sp. TaxID=259320 RepID=UPI0030DB4C5F|tara:strand:+ start:1069 stop:1938 length:870 start_codon:yes stop_codon:yes gene_type:complete
MKNIWVIGADGCLGLEICELSNLYPEYEFHFSGYMEINLVNKTEVEKRLLLKNIDVIINCMENPKYHFPDVDVNLIEGLIARTTVVIAELCKKLDIQFIQISTDEVFDGNREDCYGEEMMKRPLSLYGNLKDNLEKILIKASLDNCMIIRASWLYSIYGNNILKNLVQKMRKKEAIYLEKDKISTPTHAWELAFFIISYCLRSKQPGTGIYHYRNKGFCSKYEFGKEVQKYLSNSCEIIPVESQEGWCLEEMSYTRILNNSRLTRKFGYKTTHWKEGVERCMLLMANKI